MHKFPNVLLSGGIFAVIFFLFVAASALFRLEPLDLRERWIYVVCVIGGVVFGLLMEFGSIIPHHSIVVPLFSIAAVSVGVLVRSLR
jgi:hypothetical protein